MSKNCMRPFYFFLSVFLRSSVVVPFLIWPCLIGKKRKDVSKRVPGVPGLASGSLIRVGMRAPLPWGQQKMAHLAGPE